MINGALQSIVESTATVRAVEQSRFAFTFFSFNFSAAKGAGGAMV
jgi:hypothetical protein